ncbi:MAG TPA: hypothetical protein VK519_13230 [Pinirhizobacter sp.]|nr:hypothetical protein [Pinirhizobacter sp.]HMH68869.1 hypothetical protein [Pinirhizobacter sp.]
MQLVDLRVGKDGFLVRQMILQVKHRKARQVVRTGHHLARPRRGSKVERQRLAIVRVAHGHRRATGNIGVEEGIVHTQRRQHGLAQVLPILHARLTGDDASQRAHAYVGIGVMLARKRHRVAIVFQHLIDGRLMVVGAVGLTQIFIARVVELDLPAATSVISAVVVNGLVVEAMENGVCAVTFLPACWSGRLIGAGEPWQDNGGKSAARRHHELVPPVI